jgi:hypothetical protein
MKTCDRRSKETPPRLNVRVISRRTPRRLDLIEERVRVYGTIFGTADHRYHVQNERTPHVDVYGFAPTARRPFFTYVTAGMSDLAMHSPAELGVGYRRVELVFYAAEGRTEYVGMLDHVARAFPKSL